MQLSWVLCFRISHEAACVRQGSYLKAQLGKDLLSLSLTLLLAGLGSLSTVGSRASYPCWLLSGGHPQLHSQCENLLAKSLTYDGIMT